MRFLIYRYLVALLSLAILSGCDLVREIPFGNGYVAKNICSGIFVSDIEETQLRDRYVAPNVDPLPLVWKIDIDREKGLVTSRDIIFQDLFKQQAYYRPGFGCTLLQDETPESLDQQLPLNIVDIEIPPYYFWPLGSAGVWPLQRSNIDYQQIQQAVDDAFVESPDKTRQTAAVLVAYDNQLIAEKYASGITEDTRLLGWSMSKSFTATLIGLLQDRGMLDVRDLAPVPEWQGSDKANITIEHMLHMASGIKYQENSRGPDNDQSFTLHAMTKFADFLIDRPLVAEPGEQYNYSTAETMLLAGIAQDTLGGTMADTYHFVSENLFAPLGITDAVLEYDAGGYPGGGAYLMMKPRDWARLGLLYLNRGNWFGDQVLSQDWVDYATTPSPANPEYGAQIWVNTDQQTWPLLPEDTFAFLGYQQQSVYVIPSKQLVVVRMGFSFEDGISQAEELVAEIIDSIKD